jgi:hypothetical protein
VHVKKSQRKVKSKVDGTTNISLCHLRKKKYKIPRCCALCILFRESQNSPLWGTCRSIKHENTKATGVVEEASVTALGHCPSFLWDDEKVKRTLGPFACFEETA